MARGVVLRSVMARVVVLQNVVRSAVVTRAVVLKGTTNRGTAGCTGGHAGIKLGPSISPLQEVANRAHV